MDIYFVSLGCDKNLVDSEMMIKSLRRAGHRIIDEEALAEVIIVNTCCFIGDAKEESIQAILDLAQYKETGKCKLLVAAGCLAQRYHEEIKVEIPEVDIVIGTMGYEDLVQAIEDAAKRVETFNVQETKTGPLEYLKDIDYLPEPIQDRDSMTGGYYAYLKIAEGCDKHCTYCVIPKVRGKYRSVPMENLFSQAEHLVRNGAKELILVAQETTLYGTDLYGKKSLDVLLKKLSEIEELRWIRILYCYPEEITPNLIQAIKTVPKICHYLDIPIQHGADSVLKRMGRKTSRAEIVRMVEMLRKEVPDIVLRTTLIAGFPGETEEEFFELKRLVKEVQFDRLGVFAYSQEEDTPAGEMEGQISAEEKEKRREEIMELQQTIVFEKNKKQIDRVFEVMVEGYMAEDGVYAARTYMDAPDVDGYIFFESDWNLLSGDFVTVKVIGAEGYDLLGEIISEDGVDER